MDEVQEIPHDFEIDLHNLVVANHSFTMEAIDKSEDEDFSKIEEGLAHAEREDSRSVIIAWHKEDRWRTSSESACNKRTQRQRQTKPY